jgi:hypothetical protein
MKLSTPLLAEMELMEPSSLVHSPKLLTLDAHLEKSSILVGPWQAANARAPNVAKRPIKVEVRITMW